MSARNTEELIATLQRDNEHLGEVIDRVAAVDPWVNVSGHGDYLWRYRCVFCDAERDNGDPENHESDCLWAECKGTNNG